ncbi:hypothetical protein D3C73_658070 [compost metagenome]
MEQPKPGNVAPVYPMQPMPMPQPMPIMQQSMPMPQPMPMPNKPMPPMMQKPVHNDIHLHASYQQTSILFPQPQPKPKVHTAAVVCPPQSTAGTSAGSILVLFILLVIITRTYRKC